MNFWRLQCFIALAEAKHFGRAADRLFVSQPALSTQIRQLEESLGVVLVVRQPQVELTDAGSRLYPEALKILDLVQQTARMIASQQPLNAGRLRLLYTRSVDAEQTFDLIQAFREQAPGVTIEAQTTWTSDSVERIRSGIADAAFVRLPLADPGSLETAVLGVDEQVVVIRHDHPLARSEQVSVDQLTRFPLIHWPRGDGPGNYDALLQSFSGGRRLEFGEVQPNYGHRLAVVARTNGYALIHASLAPALPKALIAREIVPSAPQSVWGLVWDGAAAHDGARIARALAEFLRQQLAPNESNAA